MDSRYLVILAVFLNIFSSIGIILVNKMIYVRYHFPSVTLTLVHFVVTSLCLQLCASLHVFAPKSVPVVKVLPLAASFCGFVVFTNLSLMFNTVGTYQVFKSLTTPVVLLLLTIFFKKTSSLLLKMTVGSKYIMLSYSVFVSQFMG